MTSFFKYLQLFLLVVVSLTTAKPQGQCELARYRSKTPLFVLTDISNEPDDQMSLVRLLTHANEIDIKGIAGVTSVWKNDSIDDVTIRKVIRAYGKVTSNLNANVPAGAPYPNAKQLLSKVSVGHPVYGLAALKLEPSDAALSLISAADSTTGPMWVTCWGGASVLAEALNHVQKTRSKQDVAAFVKKLRVYSISDQDDAGPWIREFFPKLLYVVSIHGFSEYTLATWTGISGELLRHFDKGGPDSSLVTNEWLEKHVRVGELGKYYPKFAYIMEGDTPSFLSLIPSGLSQPEHPEWGGWGGRYILADASGRTQVFSDASDFVIGQNDDTFFSQYASIWRWREAYQYDFAARMHWSLSEDYASHNHHPVAVVNGTCGPEELQITYGKGESIVFDASDSWDPDDDDLVFDWFHYREVAQRLEGDIPRHSKSIKFTPLNAKGSVMKIKPKEYITMHVILSIKDKRKMGLTTYRRLILYPEHD